MWHLSRLKLYNLKLKAVIVQYCANSFATTGWIYTHTHFSTTVQKTMSSVPFFWRTINLPLGLNHTWLTGTGVMQYQSWTHIRSLLYTRTHTHLCFTRSHVLDVFHSLFFLFNSLRIPASTTGMTSHARNIFIIHMKAACRCVRVQPCLCTYIQCVLSIWRRILKCTLKYIQVWKLPRK